MEVKWSIFFYLLSEYSPLVIFPHKSFIFEFIVTITFPYLIELKNTNNYKLKSSLLIKIFLKLLLIEIKLWNYEGRRKDRRNSFRNFKSDNWFIMFESNIFINKKLLYWYSFANFKMKYFRSINKFRCLHIVTNSHVLFIIKYRN